MVNRFSKRWMRVALHHSLVIKMSGKVDEAYEYLRDHVRMFLDYHDMSDSRKGRGTSPKKAISSAINGRKGGRPKKGTDSDKKSSRRAQNDT